MTRYSKSIVALLGALATWGITAAEDSVYSQQELWGGLLALATAAGVYALPNRPPRNEPRRPDVSEQAGHADVGGLVYLLVAVLVVLVLLKLLGLI